MLLLRTEFARCPKGFGWVFSSLSNVVVVQRLELLCRSLATFRMFSISATWSLNSFFTTSSTTSPYRSHQDLQFQNYIKSSYPVLKIQRFQRIWRGVCVVDSLGKVVFQLSLVHWNSGRNCFDLIITVCTSNLSSFIFNKKLRKMKYVWDCTNENLRCGFVLLSSVWILDNSFFILSPKTCLWCTKDFALHA